MFISFTQPPLCWSTCWAEWFILNDHSSAKIFSWEEKSIRKLRKWWTHWPCHELSLQIPIVILCLLSFVTIAPGATLLQPWERRQWRVIYKSSRRYLSAKFPITFDKNAPVQICLDKSRVAIMLLTILQKLTSTCQLCLQSNRIFAR